MRSRCRWCGSTTRGRSGYVAGNTHLHLRKLSKQQADRYLREAPLVDGLDIVYVSYLERAKDDLEYTSNNYTPHDLEHLSTDHVHFGHGQEHRHNFGGLRRRLRAHAVPGHPGHHPAGEHRSGHHGGRDRRAAAAAGDRRGPPAGRQGHLGHNMYGFEDIPNWLTGRVHANNIFDGGTHGSYKESFYRYLNIGLKVPFSTGTDWFIYDFSRVYAMTDKPVTPRQWLDLLAEGKTYITNGPLLEFTVDGQPIGSTLELNGPRRCVIRGRAVGRIDFQRIELVKNGEVVAQAKSRAEGRTLRRGVERAAADRWPLLARAAHAASARGQRSGAASARAAERIRRAAVCAHQSHLCADSAAAASSTAQRARSCWPKCSDKSTRSSGRPCSPTTRSDARCLRFMKKASSSFAAAFLNNAVSRRNSTWDAIIIGAGAAGLAAARKLSAAGMRLLIVEARSRGRPHRYTARSGLARADRARRGVHSWSASRNLGHHSCRRPCGLRLCRRALPKQRRQDRPPG